MNKKQDKLFELLNENGYDMEDLIETISYKEVDKLLEQWQESMKEVKVRC